VAFQESKPISFGEESGLMYRWFARIKLLKIE
jgi:hypothetical protein